MVLANGVSLPMPLPNIDLPAIDLASVHLPDVTLQGIAVTGLHLPTITIPPLNPASLTKFDYIQGILSKAGMSFDDIANLPLPDLASISLSGLGNMNVGNIMGMMGGVGAIGRNEDSNNKPADAPANADEPQTTTLGPDEIDNLLGLSVITYASSA
ncbi:hypothetical protein FBU59_006311 [Linderina macrospora]|uniref:Uncharacterized protein n=1 Tax=Linderina macrospora TaxID=4868 RepID=A0ACC1J073_9FUNG|nr:hypothetical protein FBU59_006311 [Linderina macrospora]